MEFQKFKDSFSRVMVESFKTKDQYKKMNAKLDDLVALFSTFIDTEFIKEYPSFKSDIESDRSMDVYDKLIRARFLNFANKKYSKTAVQGTLYFLGISEPFDYLVRLKQAQKDLVKKLLSERGKGKNIQDDIEILVGNGTCNRDMSKFYDDRKDKDGKLKKKDKNGNPVEWAESAYLSSVFGLFEYKDETGKEILIPIAQAIGGEFGDKAINPTCPNCKNLSMTRKCPKCGTEKPEFILEAVASSVGKKIETSLTKDAKTGSIFFDPRKTALDKCVELTSAERSELYGKMKKAFDQDFFVSGSTIVKWHTKFEKDKKAICIYRGFVADKFDNEGKMGRRIVFDEEDLLAGDRLTTFVPSHVYNHNMDKVRIESDVVIIGQIVKFNKPADGSTVSNYSNKFPYVIKAHGLITMRNEKPLVVETNLIKDKIAIPSPATVPVPVDTANLEMQKKLKEYQDLQAESQKDEADTSDTDLENFLDGDK